MLVLDINRLSSSWEFALDNRELSRIKFIPLLGGTGLLLLELGILEESLDVSVFVPETPIGELVIELILHGRLEVSLLVQQGEQVEWLYHFHTRGFLDN